MAGEVGGGDDELLGRAYDARLMRRLVGYLRPYRGRTAGAMGALFVATVVQLGGPAVTAAAIDLFLRPGAGGSGRAATVAKGWLAAAGLDPSPASGLALAGGIYALFVVAGFVLSWTQYRLLQGLGQRVMFDLRREVFGRIQSLDVGFFDRVPVGRLMTRLTSDVDSLNEMFTSGIVSVMGDLVMLTGVVGLLLWLDWRLALVAFSILPLLALATAWFRKGARESYRQVRGALARINSFLQERITGQVVVRLFRAEREEGAGFAALNDRHRVENIRSIFYYAVFYPLVEVISALGLGLILWYGGGRALAGALSLGALVAFIQYAQMFYRPILDLAEKYNILQSAMASSERIFALLDERPRVVAPADAAPLGPVRGELEFDRVWFAYAPAAAPDAEPEWILRDVSFRVRPGETLALVGHTGAGKTTVSALALRFHDPLRGAVRIDGRDLATVDPRELRRHTAAVLQDAILFSGTIASNVRFGRELSDDAVRRALADAGALEFVEALPGGLEAEVRERGAGLSVGQKQLVAFARALAADPRLVILDEATSSVDSETEARIQEAMGRLLAGRTSLVIAHRLATVRRADRILVLHHGRIREEGTHEELLARRGLYWKLYLLQYRDQEGEAEGVA